MPTTGTGESLASFIGTIAHPFWAPEGASWSIASLLAPIVILIAAYGAILALLYRNAANTAFAKAFFKASTPGAILTVVNSGGVYLIVLTISAQYSANRAEPAYLDFAYNVAAATFGLALGWVLGIVISPSSKDEASEFSMLTKAVSTFLTGYVLGYLKDITVQQIQHFLGRPGVAFRLMIGTACCFSTLAVVFVSRRAETMRANAARNWFISYTPTDPKHAQSLRSDLLACGPFETREDALAQIELIKNRDEFKALKLVPVRIEIVTAGELVAPVVAVAGGGADGGEAGNGGHTGTGVTGVGASTVTGTDDGGAGTSTGGSAGTVTGEACGAIGTTGISVTTPGTTDVSSGAPTDGAAGGDLGASGGTAAGTNGSAGADTTEGRRRNGLSPKL